MQQMLAAGTGAMGEYYYPDDCEYYGDCEEPNATPTESEIKSTTAQVVNGVEARKPYMVALYRMLTPRFGQHICGGFLYIPPRRDAAFVVTSAQCIPRRASPCSYKAATGLWDLNDFDAAQENGMVFDIVNIARHPGFSESTLSNDVALLKLKSVPTTQSSINLYNDANLQGLQDGAELTVLGWGSNSSTTRKQGKLLKGQVEFEDLEDCQKAYAGDKSIRGRTVTSEMLCTVSTDQDACLGDTGGPVVEEGDDVRTPDLAAGIISWGAGCAETGRPSVYTSIGAMRSWMDVTMERMAGEKDEGRC